MSAARSPSGRGRPRHEIPLSPALILAALLGIVIIATLWWAYFQVLMPAGEQALRRLSGPARVALARDAYSLLHLPILAGIVLFALGLEKELSDAKHSGGTARPPRWTT